MGPTGIVSLLRPRGLLPIGNGFSGGWSAGIQRAGPIGLGPINYARAVQGDQGAEKAS